MFIVYVFLVNYFVTTAGEIFVTDCVLCQSVKFQHSHHVIGRYILILSFHLGPVGPSGLFL
jgi:hypothetical protein